MKDKQFQLNGKPVWLVHSERGEASSCSQCVFNDNVPDDEGDDICPFNEGQLACATDRLQTRHFTDKNPEVESTFPSERTNVENTALNIQVGGGHYKDMKIQPVEYIHANNLSFLEGNVVKYITRHKTKNKAQDIRKIIHYCTLILQLEYNETYDQE